MASKKGLAMDAAQTGGLVLIFVGFIFALLFGPFWAGASIALSGAVIYFVESWRSMKVVHAE